MTWGQKSKPNVVLTLGLQALPRRAAGVADVTAPVVVGSVAEVDVGAVAVSPGLGLAAEAGLRRRCPEVFSLSGPDAAHRLHRGPRCGEEDPRAPRVAGRTAPDPAGPGAACDARAVPCRLNHATAVDDPCVDGGPAPDGLKEPVSGGSADRQPEQKSSFTGGAARPSLEKAPCSSYPPAPV